jgi:hypothetical protein
MASASQSTNPLGAVVVLDGENPRIITAMATETISGGFLVNTSGATGDVGSQASSFIEGDIKVVGAQTPALFNGIALQNAGSNSACPIGTRGAFLMRAGEIVSGGALVGHNGSGNVVNWKGHISGTALIQDTIVGRALTSSTSGTTNYCLVYINT